MSRLVGKDPLRVRTMVRADLPAVIRLLADDDLGATREVVSTDVAPAYLDAFDAMARDAAHQLLVADAAGEVVGCLQVSAIPGLSRAGMLRAQIEGVRVASSMRGRGVGEALVHAAIDFAEARGCGLVQLTTDRSRVDAHRFYERLGFEPTHVGMKLMLLNGDGS